MTMKMTISILSLAFVTLASPGCFSLECTAIGCTDQMVWRAELPTAFTFEDVRALDVRACRNDVCFEGSFAAMEIDPPAPGSGFSMVISPSGAGMPYVTAWVWARPLGAYDVEVTWNDPVFTDGDVYAFEVTDGDGELVLDRAPTAVTYEIRYPNGPDCDPGCATASLEGPTL